MKVLLCPKCSAQDYLDAPWWRAPDDERCFTCGATHGLEEYFLRWVGTYTTETDIIEVYMPVSEADARPQEFVTDETQIF